MVCKQWQSGLFKLLKAQNDPVADLFEHILKGEVTNGFVRGRRENAIFVPNIYRDGQASMIREFVESNDCIGKFFFWIMASSPLEFSNNFDQ